MSTSHHTVSIEQVQSILRGAQQQGMAKTPLLLRAGISPALLDSELARVSQHQYATLIRVIRRAMRDEMWGLMSRPVAPGSFGQCLQHAVRCSTLGEALRSAFAFYHLLIADFTPRLSARDEMARIRFITHRPMDPRLIFGIKAFMLFTFASASWLVARRIPILGIDYPDAKLAETSRVYQAPIRQAQPFMGMSFEAHWLDLPVVQTPVSLREFLRGAPANLIVKYRDNSSMSDRIRRLFRRRLGEELPSLDAVCEALAVTPQTLRRRLREEGRGFQDIKDELRRDIAIELLLQTHLPLLAIANHLGFSEASTFHRAFKGWTGVAPGEYRQAHAEATPA
ncbi:MAG: AraC family transcriptional regulator [Limnohabitans sp.]|nr:AraC family transcriptional regulator [Limnohabitans sp.]